MKVTIGCIALVVIAGLATAAVFTRAAWLPWIQPAAPPAATEPSDEAAWGRPVEPRAAAFRDKSWVPNTPIPDRHRHAEGQPRPGAGQDRRSLQARGRDRRPSHQRRRLRPHRESLRARPLTERSERRKGSGRVSARHCQRGESFDRHTVTPATLGWALLGDGQASSLHCRPHRTAAGSAREHGNDG